MQSGVVQEREVTGARGLQAGVEVGGGAGGGAGDVEATAVAVVEVPDRLQHRVEAKEQRRRCWCTGKVMMMMVVKRTTEISAAVVMLSLMIAMMIKCIYCLIPTVGR